MEQSFLFSHAMAVQTQKDIERTGKPGAWHLGNVGLFQVGDETVYVVSLFIPMNRDIALYAFKKGSLGTPELLEKIQ